MTTAVALVAIVVRVRLVTNGGGFLGLQGYDDGVYYTAADAWIHGRWPYRDFVLLHPPGIVLALSPFAALGRLTTDATGLVLARVAFLVLGGLNAAMVYRLARRCGPVAAVVAGLVYAGWYPAAYADRVTLMEPLGTATLLGAMVLLRRGAGRWSQLLAGAAVGACLTLKIWNVVPVLVLVGWCLVAQGWRSVGPRLLATAACVVGVGYLPFLAAAPRQLPRMVVLDQVGRPTKVPDRLERLPKMTGLSRLSSYLDVGTLVHLSVAVAVVMAACGALALITARSRLWALLFFACAGVLLASPSHYLHYGGYLAAPLALVVGAAIGRAAGDGGGRSGTSLGRRTAVATPAVLAVLALAVSTASARTGQRFPGAAFERLAADRPCVVADDPTALALMNVLSRDLAAGCPLWVDVSGISYDAAAQTAPDGSAVRRPLNRRYQRQVYAYLTSGSTTVLARRGGNGFSRTTRQRLEALPVLSRQQGASLLGRPGRDGSAAAPTPPARTTPAEAPLTP